MDLIYLKQEMSLEPSQPTQNNINNINITVKLKNAKTEKYINQKDDKQINSIKVKSSRHKSNLAEIYGLSKTDRNIDPKFNLVGRKDSRGVPIIKGNKTHIISYADNLYGTNLANIMNVESYKGYNSIAMDSGGVETSLNKKMDGISCKCSIL